MLQETSKMTYDCKTLSTFSELMVLPLCKKLAFHNPPSHKNICCRENVLQKFAHAMKYCTALLLALWT